MKLFNGDYLKIFKLIKPYGLRISGINFLNLFSVTFSIFSIGMLAPFLSMLFNPSALINELPEFSFSAETLSGYLQYGLSCIIREKGKHFALATIIIFIFALFLLKNVFAYFSMSCVIPMRTDILKNLREKCFGHLMIFPLSFYSKTKKGDILSRTINDIQEIDNSILQYLQQLFKEIPTLILFLGVLLFIQFKFTLFILITLPIAMFIIGSIQRKLKKKSIEAKQKESDMLSISEESIYGLRIIKSYNNIPYRYEHFKSKNEEYNNLLIKIDRLKDLSSPVSDFLGMCVVILILIAGNYLILDQRHFSAEMFITYLVLFTQIINPIKTIADSTANFKKGFASLQRIEELLRTDEKIRETKNPSCITDLKKNIKFNSVYFAYENENILKNISFEIHKGEMIGICGSSGSGKSTLADLLPRFYDVNSGNISIDGINIKEYYISNLRNLFSIISQDDILFNDTIFNNIALGKPDADEQDVWKAAEISNIAGYIKSLDKGLQTEIGDRGIKLSGGQKQKISIARAILKNAPILIMDEATSALDSESEKEVQNAINALMKNKTSIIIAHRLSTIFTADKILVIENGEIKESGSHKELMSNNGIYRKMVSLQGFD